MDRMNTFFVKLVGTGEAKPPCTQTSGFGAVGWREGNVRPVMDLSYFLSVGAVVRIAWSIVFILAQDAWVESQSLWRLVLECRTAPAWCNRCGASEYKENCSIVKHGIRVPNAGCIA